MSLQLGYTNAQQSIPPLTMPPEAYKLAGVELKRPLQFQQRKGRVNTAAATQAYNEGLTYFLLGQWQRAAEAFQRSVEIAPSAQAYVLLGYAYLNPEEFLRAANYFEKAAKLSPQYIAAHLSLAIAYNYLGKTDRAIKAIRKAIKADPQNSDAYFLLGRLHQQLHHWDEAETAYRQAIKLRKVFILAHQYLAQMYYELGLSNEQERDSRLHQAIEIYHELIGVEPVTSAVYNNIGFIYDKLGEREKASEAYQKAIETLGNDLLSLNTLGTTLLDVKRYIEARRVFEKALQVMDDDSRRQGISRAMLLTNLGVVCLGLYGSREPQTGDEELLREAEQLFLAALNLDPKYVHAQINLGAARYEQGRIDEAIEAFKKVIEIDPDNDSARDNLSSLLEEKLEQRLLEIGLLKEIKKPITDFRPYEDRTPIVVQGRPVSETLVEDRR